MLEATALPVPTSCSKSKPLHMQMAATSCGGRLQLAVEPATLEEFEGANSQGCCGGVGLGFSEGVRSEVQGSQR